MTRTLRTEICVIGGGPAGSTVARRLAHLGHEVLLLEENRFPRPHIGESLSPAILPLLDALDLRDRIECAPFLRPHRTLIRWHDETVSLMWQPDAPGFQVDRGEFDLLLLNIALEAGVKLLQPVRALRPVFDAAAGWIVPFQCGRQPGSVTARFLIDASGRRSRMSSRRRRTSPPTLALYGYWQNTDLAGAETRVEAGRESWFWGAPLPGNTFNVTAFLDPKRCQVARPSDLESFYRTLLAETTLLSACLQGRLIGDVTACTASSCHDEEPIGNSYIKVGEASFAIDPLSSQGSPSSNAVRISSQHSLPYHANGSRERRGRHAILPNAAGSGRGTTWEVGCPLLCGATVVRRTGFLDKTRSPKKPVAVPASAATTRRCTD